MLSCHVDTAHTLQVLHVHLMYFASILFYPLQLAFENVAN